VRLGVEYTSEHQSLEMVLLGTVNTAPPVPTRVGPDEAQSGQSLETVRLGTVYTEAVVESEPAVDAELKSWTPSFALAWPPSFPFTANRSGETGGG
jgi:hypothetical protein